MSPKKAVLSAGVLALGLAGMAALWGAEDPASPRPALPGSSPSAPTLSVLLLSRGEVVRGSLSETDDGYVLATPAGELRYKRHQVEGVFGSLAEVYLYKRSRTPANDPDERLKLALWCLAQELFGEAQSELEAVLRISPDYERARQMLHHLQAHARRTQARDPEVVRTRAEAPAPLSSRALQEVREAARRNPTVAAAPPIIFDLQRPLAVKRFQEFAAYVHPELQRRCASCHHEQSNLDFQLIQARARNDYNNELLVRANLDATLRLVDPDDPPRSRLLSSTIMPHKPTGRPILSGPNDIVYRQLLVWVSGLRSAASAARWSPEAPQPSGPAAPPGGFAADRAGALPGPGVVPASAGHSPPASSLPRLDPAPTVSPRPAGQILPGSATGLPQSLPPPQEFPTSPLLGGPNAAPLNLKPEAVPADPQQPQRRTIQVPGIGEVPVVDPKERPAVPAPAAKKPIGLNVDALQKFMTGRPQ
jgi:hypothetical protein